MTEGETDNVYAMPGGVRLDTCVRIMRDALLGQPMSWEDKALARLASAVPKEDLVGDDWPSPDIAQAAAEWLITEAIDGDELGLWVMAGTEPVPLEIGNAYPDWPATLLAGQYISNETPQSIAAGRYLYVADAVWRAFLRKETALRAKQQESGRKPPSAVDWGRWVVQYRRDHIPLPDADREILPEAKLAFPGNRVTQRMVRQEFGGGKQGPRAR